MNFKEFLKEADNSFDIDEYEKTINFVFRNITVSPAAVRFDGWTYTPLDHSPNHVKYDDHKKFDKNTGEIFDTVSGFIDSSTGKVKPEFQNVDSISMTFEHGEANIDWPLYFPGMISAREIDVGFSSAKVVIESFEDWPKCKDLIIKDHYVSIKSLKGIEDLGLKRISLSFEKEEQFKCGLLRFLKCKDLLEGDFKVSIWGQDDTRLEKALDIIKKHIKDKDIIECQSELLDAELEEYAKL